MKDSKAYDKIRRARTALVLRHPFFASLALRLRVQEDSRCHTAWTDGEVFAYNPHYVNMLSSEKLEGLTAHIVMHPACNHHKRRQDRDSATWNKACDYVINGLLLDAGFTLPDGFLYKKEHEDRSAEAVYTILASTNSEEDEEEDGQAEQQQKEETNEVNENEGQSKADDDSESSDDQSEDSSGGDPGQSGEIRDSQEGEGGGENEQSETDWDKAVLQAAITARGMGELPGGVARLIEEQLQSKLSWRQLLSRFIEQSARSDYSWLVPNRRFIHQGLYFPSLKNSEIGRIVIAIDTSGSVGQKELSQFGAEISQIQDEYPTTIELLHCDTKIVKTETFDPADRLIKIEPVGGGGTDFRPVFKHIEDSNQQPNCLIYLTDMECSGFPQEKPNYPVLWVRIGDGSGVAPFGETISLNKPLS